MSTSTGSMPYMPIKSLTRENLIKLVKNVLLFVRLVVDFERYLQIHHYSVSMVLEDRFRLLFLFKYRRVAKMINMERLGWIFNVFCKFTLTVLVSFGGSASTPILC